MEHEQNLRNWSSTTFSFRLSNVGNLLEVPHRLLRLEDHLGLKVDEFLQTKSIAIFTIRQLMSIPALGRLYSACAIVITKVPMTQSSQNDKPKSLLTNANFIDMAGTIR